MGSVFGGCARDTCKKLDTNVCDFMGSLKQRYVSNAAKHVKTRMGDETYKNGPQGLLSLDLIPIPDDNADGDGDGVKPLAHICYHVVLCPGALGLRRSRQSVLDELFAE